MIQLIRPFKIKIDEDKVERGTNKRKHMTLEKLYDVLAIDNTKGTNEVIIIDDEGKINTLKFHFAIAVLDDAITPSVPAVRIKHVDTLETELHDLVKKSVPLTGSADKAVLVKKAYKLTKAKVEGYLDEERDDYAEISPKPSENE